MEFLLQDLRFGARILRRAPLVSGCIIVVLALGIGANSAMFALVDAMLLHPVRYPHPESLVFVWSFDPQGTSNDLSAGDFADLRTQAKSLSDLAVWRPATFVVLGGERPRQMDGARVTASFFRALGVKPLLGRTFLPDEDGLDHPANAAHSAVISARFWRQDLGADPNVLGRTIRVDSVPYAIVGVMPEDFQFWWQPGDIWVPVTLRIHERDYHDLVVIARMTSSRARVAAELTSIARSLGEAYPKSDKGWTIQTEDFQERLLNRTFRTRLILLSAAMGLILLIACSNVANLLLARSAGRAQELAVRVSLGATGSRLARQLLTETALLAVLGGGLGLAMAWGLIRAFPKIVPPGAIPGGSVEMSLPVIWFSLAISFLTCLLVGLAPAISAARSQAQNALKDSARGSTAGRARRQVRQILVAAEVAIALVLLASAWLMVGSFRALTRIDTGFDPSNVLTVRVVLPSAKYDAAHAVRFYRSALDGIRALPGVRSATLGTSLPLATNMLVRFDLEGSPHDEGERPSVPYFAVGVDHFRALGIPLKRGRTFTEADNETAPLVAIVSEALAAKYFPNQDPIGKRIVANRPIRGAGEETVKLEIVGVVGNINLTNLAFDTKPMIYVPHPQNPFTRGVWFAVRTSGNPAALASAVRSEFTSIDHEQPIEQITSLDQMLNNQYAEPRFQTELMGSFALLALLLAAIGIYGVNAYAVTQRRNEIGLRMALGATRGDVLRQVIGRGLLPTAIGIVVGLAGAAAVAVSLKSSLVGAGSTNPIAFLGAALLLGFVAALACYFPARKAIRIDPAITLRMD